MEWTESIREWIRLNRTALYRLRQDLHRHPEPSGCEIYTAGVLRAELERIGLSWKPIAGTGTIAELRGAFPGPAVMLRADIDALPITERSLYPFPSENPGYMHACGHDVHASALLGAAAFLYENRAMLRGSVRFVFQHAEEFGHGSQDFLANGTAKGIHRIYGFHVCTDAMMGTAHITKGTDAASCDHMLIRLFGEGAHIAKPHCGNDATEALADIILHLKALRSRLDPLVPVLVGIGRVNSGSSWNIISDRAEIEGTVRALSMDARKEALKAVEREIHRVADIHGVTAEVTFEMNTPCLVNDSDAYETMRAAAVQMFGDTEKVIDTAVPLGFGGDDFAAFSEIIPGCFIHLGTAIEGAPDTSRPLHSDDIHIRDEVVPLGCELLIRCALAHL